MEKLVKLKEVDSDIPYFDGKQVMKIGSKVERPPTGYEFEN